MPRNTDAGPEPQRGERHPRDRRDKAHRLESRRDEAVDPAEPGHQQAERNADQHREREPHAEALQARQQVLVHAVAGEGLRDQLREAHDHVPRRRKEVARRDARQCGGRPHGGEGDCTGGAQAPELCDG
ncbi:MAG: hypothetical protein MUE62_11170 [Burkholderiaceae bacterium]|nr:hypothetical protein [Burkholderiaceae bacterium]